EQLVAGHGAVSRPHLPGGIEGLVGAGRQPVGDEDPRAQPRLTSRQGRSLSTRGSPGRPSTRSPRMFFMISEVPPSIGLARARRYFIGGLRRPIAVSSGSRKA